MVQTAKVTKEMQKNEAMKRMKILKIMAQPVKEFKENGKVNLSEGPGYLYWLNDEEQKMVDDFEEENGALVYHVIKTFYEDGVMYALLYVSKYPEEWSQDKEDLEDGYALSYVVNTFWPDCSEFGSIGVAPSIGGVRRTA